MEGEKLRMVYQGAREFLEEAAGKEVVEGKSYVSEPTG